MGKKTRRVVTGHNAEGKSTFILDGDAPNVKEMLPGLFTTELWITRATPADNKDNIDAADAFPYLEPPRTGSAFRVVEFPPSNWQHDTDAAEKARKGWESIGAGHAQKKGTANIMMHTTASVDYAVVMTGEIWAIVETGETLLRAGDVLVQRGTAHAWANRTDAPCLVAFVLIGAEPIQP
ncbi:MAG TPA: cupin domain-containing protein [Xanthobacteraceae bacterium]